jgi:hypothetical protein
LVLNIKGKVNKIAIMRFIVLEKNITLKTISGTTFWEEICSCDDSFLHNIQMEEV